MKTKRINSIVSVLLLFFAFVGCSPRVAPYYIRMTDSEMKRNPESWMLDFQSKLKWNYTQGLELDAFLDVWEKTGEKKYFDYVLSYADTIISEDATIETYKLSNYNIDHVNPGKMLFRLYEGTKDSKYKMAMDTLVSQMSTHPRTANGGFWHKKIYPHQVWLDGIYMAPPFLAEYGSVFNQPDLIDDAVLQITTAYDDLVDESTGLLYHGWDESREQRWADPLTGKSPNFWSRSIGWYMMAIVDVLDFLPQDHPKRNEVTEILHKISTSVEKYQEPQSGMWYQVTDQGNRSGNYLESSGSIMFIYSWVKGAKNGYLSNDFLVKGQKAYAQFLKQFVVENQDGTITIKDACSVAGLGGEKNYRDGSFEYYISELKRDNDAKVVGPFIKVSILLEK
ncbi:MAG: glycoside hydrolase family 105 protein [Paludibacteraceae bacterium]